MLSGWCGRQLGIGPHVADTDRCGGGRDMLPEIIRPDDGRCAGAPQHGGDALDVGVLAAEIHGIGKRTGKQAGVLAAEEGRHEVYARLGDDADAVSAAQAEIEKPASGRTRAVAKVAIGERRFELATRRIEVEAGLATGRIVERLAQRPEVAQNLRERDIRARARLALDLSPCPRWKVQLQVVTSFPHEKGYQR